WRTFTERAHQPPAEFWTPGILRSGQRRLRRRLEREASTKPDPSKSSEVGSGAPDKFATSVRTLSRANAGATTLLKVRSARLKGNVLAMPANPPVKIGSGVPP